MDGHSTFTVSGIASERIASGEWVALAFIFFSPADNSLKIQFPENFSPEEGIAMLKKYKMLPAGSGWNI